MLATYRVKWNEKYQKKWKVKFDYGELEAPVAEKIARVCRKAFRLMQIHDYGRMDLRLTPDGRIVMIEANPNPGLACGDEVAEAALKAGIGYVELIDRIVRLALRRYGK